jgi:hypothetical protein
MIRKDITIIDLGGDNWSRLMRLPKELAALRDGGGKPAPRALLVIYRGLRVLRAIDLAERRTVEVEWLGVSRLDLLSSSLGYPLVIALEETALSRVFEHAQRDLDFRDDMGYQWAGFIRGAAREWRRTIFTYPEGPARIPVVPFGVVESFVRSLVPDDSLLLFAVTERGQVWTSVVLGFRDGDFWLLTSLDTLGMEEGDLSGGGLDAAAQALSSKFGGKVRAVVVERSELERIGRSRFPVADLYWALNSGDMRRLNVPNRWKILMFASALAATLKKNAK